MSKIKVVIVVPSLEIGGAENMVCQLSKALDKEVVELDIVCLSSKKNSILEQDLSLHGLKVNYLNNKDKLSLKTVLLLWRYLSRSNPNIVHTHLHSSLYAFPWIYTHRVRLLHTIHSTPKFEFSSRIIGLMKYLYKKKKAVPVAISEKIKVETSDLYNLPLDQIELVYNPVNLKKFKCEQKNINECFKFIHVARLNSAKNQKLLLQAFKLVKQKFPNSSLTIVGDGELREELIKYVGTLNIQDSVMFTGNISNVEKYLNSSDVFVLSSIYEGLPLSILEAMAAGLPIISTKVGGVEDIIKGNGILVENRDLQALSSAMLQLAADNKLREQMSNNSYRLVKKYDISIIAQEYGRLYQKYC